MAITGCIGCRNAVHPDHCYGGRIGCECFCCSEQRIKQISPASLMITERFRIDALKNGQPFSDSGGGGIEFRPQFDLRQRTLTQFVEDLKGMGLTIRRIYRAQGCPTCEGSGIMWMPMENEEWLP